MGLLCMVMIAVLASAELVFRQRNVFRGLGLLILTLILVWAGLHMFSGTSARVAASSKTLAGTAPPETSKSTSDRVEIWKVSFEIIKSNLWFGVGTGDVKDRLIEQYQEKNIEHALEFRLNAHNQYLQTFLTLGLPGIAALVLMLILPMIEAFRRRFYLYFIFLLVFSVNILPESMLEEQAGVVWYTFFNCVLFSLNRE
jgi:O-antigen ligase